MQHTDARGNTLHSPHASDHHELHKREKKIWILRSRRLELITRNKLVVGLLLPLVVIFLIALVFGLALNAAYTGDAWGGGEARIKINARTSDGNLITFNALESGCMSAAVVVPMALLRFAVRNYAHPRAYGIFSFCAYTTLLLTLLSQVYSGSLTVITTPAASNFASQIYTFMEGNFNYQNEKFATTFRDISSQADYWNWLKGPFRNFLLAQSINSQAVGANRAMAINGPAMRVYQLKNLYPWLVSWCTMRFVLAEQRDIDLLSYVGTKKFKVKNLPGAAAQQLAPSGMQRAFTHNNFSVSTLPNGFTNIYGVNIDAWNLDLALSYPGAGGVVLTDKNTACALKDGREWKTAEQASGFSGCVYRGTWFAETFNMSYVNPNIWAENYDREIGILSQLNLLPSNLALAETSCMVVDSNNGLQATLTYAVEFDNSGKVAPAEPLATVASFPIASPSVVYFPLVLGLYILSEELQDLVVGGWKSYLVQSGWLNLMDVLTVVTLLLVFLFHFIFFGVIPQIDMDNIRGDTWYTMAKVRGLWQTLLGISCFAMVFKGLKFTHNVPIMSHIGNTFSHSMVNVVVFLMVVMVIMLGFGILFNLMYTVSALSSFDTLGDSMFSLFRGLLGDIDVDGMASASPIFGRILFCLYVTVVLFVAFTILIALVCESFTAVMDDDGHEGVIVNVMACYRAVASTEEDQDIATESDDTASGDDTPTLKRMLEEQSRRLDSLEDLLRQHLDPSTKNDHTMAAESKVDSGPDLVSTSNPLSQVASAVPQMELADLRLRDRIPRTSPKSSMPENRKKSRSKGKRQSSSPEQSTPKVDLDPEVIVFDTMRGQKNIVI